MPAERAPRRHWRSHRDQASFPHHGPAEIGISRSCWGDGSCVDRLSLPISGPLTLPIVVFGGIGGALMLQGHCCCLLLARNCHR